MGNYWLTVGYLRNNISSRRIHTVITLHNLYTIVLMYCRDIESTVPGVYSGLEKGRAGKFYWYYMTTTITTTSTSTSTSSTYVGKEN